MQEYDRKLALKYFYEVSKKIQNFNFEKSKNINESIVHKVKTENVLINDIVNIDIESNTFQSDLSLYYSIACPNFACNFIFDHPLDHYSFMLILELARQISIGVTHKYKGIPVEKIKNTVSGIDLKIHNFAELDYPLIVGCVDEVIKSKPTMQIRDLYFYFVQKENLCAEVKSSISIMNEDLYNRYRVNTRRNVIGEQNVNLVTNIDLISNVMYNKI